MERLAEILKEEEGRNSQGRRGTHGDVSVQGENWLCFALLILFVCDPSCVGAPYCSYAEALDEQYPYIIHEAPLVPSSSFLLLLKMPDSQVRLALKRSHQQALLHLGLEESLVIVVIILTLLLHLLFFLLLSYHNLPFLALLRCCPPLQLLLQL